jgi:bacteriocin-like protein
MHTEVLVMELLDKQAHMGVDDADIADSRAIRELSEDELQLVSGGFFPAALFAGALVGHTGVLGATGGSISMGAGVAAHIISGIGLGAAAFSLGAAYGGGGGATRARRVMVTRQ